MRQITMAMCALVALVGCTKDETKAECTYKHTNPAFCFSPPAGFTAQPEMKLSDGKMTMTFSAGKNSFNVDWNNPTKFADNVAGAKVHVGQNKLVAEGDLENGGYWCHATIPEASGPTHLVTYIVKGKANWIELGAGVKDEAAANAILAAGKSLKVD